MSPHRLILTMLGLWVINTAAIWRSYISPSTYSEDLSRHRVSFKTASPAEQEEDPASELHAPKKGTVVFGSITEQLDHLLALQKTANAQKSQTAGFTIQIYAGNSREQALKAKNQVYLHYPQLQPQLSYDATSYTVRVGDFLDKIEAYRACLALKKKLPAAIIRPILLPKAPQTFTQPDHLQNL